MIPNAEIPQRITWQGRQWLVVDKMVNIHYRALLMPIGGGNPCWISDADLATVLSTKGEAK